MNLRRHIAVNKLIEKIQSQIDQMMKEDIRPSQKNRLCCAADKYLLRLRESLEKDLHETTNQKVYRTF